MEKQFAQWMEEECSQMMSQFFRELREKKKAMREAVQENAEKI